MDSTGEFAMKRAKQRKRKISFLVTLGLLAWGGVASAQLVISGICTHELTQSTSATLLPPCQEYEKVGARGVHYAPVPDIALEPGQAIDFSNNIAYGGGRGYDIGSFAGYVWIKVQGEWMLMPYYRVVKFKP